MKYEDLPAETRANLERMRRRSFNKKCATHKWNKKWLTPEDAEEAEWEEHMNRKDARRAVTHLCLVKNSKLSLLLKRKWDTT